MNKLGKTLGFVGWRADARFGRGDHVYSGLASIHRTKSSSSHHREVSEHAATFSPRRVPGLECNELHGVPRGTRLDSA